MLNEYLKPEKIGWNNKHFCQNCQSHQEAIKTITILECPTYLICTLSRFQYDRTTATAGKILTDIHYELSLKVPFGEVGQAKEELYRLVAVVVHSGVSTNSGHYYSVAKKNIDFEDSDQVITIYVTEGGVQRRLI